MAIRIDGIAYSPVQSDHEEEDIWIASTKDVDVDADVVGIFQGYIEEIAYKRDMGQVAVGHFDEGARAEALFERILALDLDLDGYGEGYEEFEAVSLSFAHRLVNEMDGSTASGILFTILARENGTRLVGLLKLDLEEEATLSVLDRDTRELRSESLEDVLPEPDQLQKGCIHPVIDVENFNLSGDVKFLQKDSQAQYFEQFLDCVTSSGSLDQFRTIYESLDELKTQYTGHGLSQDDIRQLDQVTQENDLVKEEEVHEVSEDILGREYDEDDLERKLYEMGEDKIIADSTNAPQHVKYTVDEDIDIKAPVSALDHDRLEIHEPEHQQDDWVITIRGSTAEKTFQQ